MLQNWRADLYTAWHNLKKSKMETQENKDSNSFSKQVSEKENRKLKALKDDKESVWTGLGVFGIVGWSIVVPVISGALLGKWLDGKYPESFSWTLTLMVSGLALGCIVAWNWVNKEDKKMHQ